ncbi:hypothetical protein LO772_30825 [Yinghuangia sp. ASG 101]|uniref:hypothetical protein n=1 Tax=Yinghuangia sp. ASG 101 TaxID=2896848 RepID=UPI001E51EE19|nr:hypothetical protein [Yinghuangia sp. ASG 101]UGQ11152.1 hypothetical protein LO772_30825 [Yinghuangia sp. ASG 101]
MTKKTPTALVVADVKDSEITRILGHVSSDRVAVLPLGALFRGVELGWSLGRGLRVNLGGSELPPESLESVETVLFRPSSWVGADQRPRMGLSRVDGLVEPEFAPFMTAEIDALVYGALTALGHAAWMNHPDHARLAERKIPQLVLARELGLAVPETVVSADPGILADFWESCSGEVVCKAIGSASTWHLAPRIPAITRSVERTDVERLPSTPRLPTLFQRKITAAYDLRVTVVGNELFAAAIFSQSGSSPLDWRLDYTVPMRTITVDSVLAEQLTALVAQLGLHYAAIDLRVDRDGRHYFLEANSYGVYEFIEELAGCPISAAIASWLTS